MTDSTYIVRSNHNLRPTSPIEPGSRARTVERGYTLISPNSVTFGVSYKIDGLSKSGKAYSRWEDRMKTVFKVNELKSGKKHLNVLRVEAGAPGRRGRRFWTISNQISTVESTIPDGSEHLLTDLMSRTNFPQYTGEFSNIISRSMFPAANHWWEDESAWELSRILPNVMVNLSDGLREPNVAEMTRTMFGKTRYRKDLVKAVAGNKSLAVIDYLACFRGLVPTDWIIDALDESERGDNTLPFFINRKDAVSLRRIVAGMRLARRRTLMRSVIDGDGRGDGPHVVSNTLHAFKNRQHMLTDRRVLEATSFTQIHDIVMPPHNRGEVLRRDYDNAGNLVHNWGPSVEYVNEQIPQSEVCAKIDALTFKTPGLRLVCAKDTDMMRTWSNEMSNCISSYAYQAVEGSGLYIGIYLDDKLIGNIELKPVNFGKRYGYTVPTEVLGICILKQILGRFNQNLDDGIKMDVLSTLLKYGIMRQDKMNEAWGMDDYVAWNVPPAPPIMPIAGYGYNFYAPEPAPYIANNYIVQAAANIQF